MARSHTMTMSALLASVVAFLGCENAPPAPAGTVRTEVGGETFFLEPALDERTRIQGLSDRASIPEDGGMIFIFPAAIRTAFVMRDCLVPIDIIFVADNQKIVAMHAMEIDPRRPNEPDRVYENRLKKYGAPGKVRIVIELAGGSIERLGLTEGDQVRIDGLEMLKSTTK